MFKKTLDMTNNKDIDNTEYVPQKITLEELLIGSEKLFGNEVESIAENANVQIFRDNNFDENAYLLWKETLLTLCKDKDKLKLFIIWTFFNNLAITRIDADDIKTINYICDLYIEKNEAQLSSYLFSVKATDSMEKCLDQLAGHFSCLLTNLKVLSELVEVGCVCLKLGTEAKNLVQKYATSYKNPYLIRISNRKPNNVVVTYMDIDEPSEAASNYTDDSDATFFTIEGKRLGFKSAESLVSLISRKDQLDILIIGELSLEKALSRNYIVQTKDRYMHTIQRYKKGSWYVQSGKYFDSPNTTEKENNESKHNLVKFFEALILESSPKMISPEIIMQLFENEYKNLKKPTEKKAFFLNMLDTFEICFTIVLQTSSPQSNPTFFVELKQEWQKQSILTLQNIYYMIFSDLVANNPDDRIFFKSISSTHTLPDYKNENQNITAIREKINSVSDVPILKETMGP